MNTENLNSLGAISNDELTQLVALASLLGVVLACVLALLAWYTNNRKLEQRTTSHTGLYFAVTFVLGFAAYCVGMLPYNNAPIVQQLVGMMGVAPMALVHAVGMFLLQSDISEVSNACHNNWWFMTLFSLVHTAAAFISTTVLIQHFGFSLVAKLRFRLWARFGREAEELYVFWGMNEPSYLLGKDILRHASERHRLVFVYDGRQDAPDGQGPMQSQLLSFLKMQPTDLQRFKELRCFITQPAQHLPSLRLSPTASQPVSLLRGELQMSDLARVIQKTTGTVHIFFLGQDEPGNLRAVTHLPHDEILVERARQGRLTRLYARAEDTRISQAVLNINREPQLDIRLIDASEYSINYLKSQPAYHPIRYVDIDKKQNLGTVRSPFHSMIVGFGETGQAALRYLYEYGAFVDYRSTAEEDTDGKDATGHQACVFRSPFQCDIVDPNILQSNHFFAEYPGMVHEEGDTVCIESHPDSAESDAFARLVDRYATRLNYMVIATGNDDLNLDIAVRVFMRIRQVRRDLSRLSIFVKCASAERALHFRAVIDYYNREQPDTIILFGTNEMIFTFDHIVHNSYELQGRLYNESYCRVNHSPDNYWKTRHEKLVKRGTLDALASLRRKEWEDSQNAYHAATKAYLYTEACPKVRPTDELLRLVCGQGDECNFRRQEPLPTTDEVTAPATGTPICVMARDTHAARRVLTEAEDLFLRNLARLEHLRWNASHEALGYIPLELYVRLHGDNFEDEPYETRHTCSERRKCHNCLVGWEQLDQESLATWNEIVAHDGYRWNPDYKLADFGVVANSLYHSLAAKAPSAAQ